jgi:hypothetical protein
LSSHLKQKADKRAFSIPRNPELENSIFSPQLIDSPRKQVNLTRTIHSQNDTFFSKEINLDSKLSTARKQFDKKVEMNKFREKQIIDKITESVAETEIQTELAWRKLDHQPKHGENIVSILKQSMETYLD